MLSQETVQAITRSVKDTRANLAKEEQVALDALLGAFGDAAKIAPEIAKDNEGAEIVKEILSLGGRIITTGLGQERAATPTIITLTTLTTILTSHPWITCRAQGFSRVEEGRNL